MSADGRYIQVPQMLAVLSYNGDYHYIDRLGYSHSKDLALYYLREAIRDYNALKRSPPRDLPNEVKDLLQKINPDFLEREVENISKIGGLRELREALSIICAKALSTASRFVGREEGQ